ncbi:hypothetical protein ACN47E_010168 [Coniothyrium glycines]
MSRRLHARVIIAGGSIAGLTLANILEQLGVDYLLLEKYKQIAPNLGASIAIFPNGYRILDQLGCYDAITELVGDADAFETLSLRDQHGQAIQELSGVSSIVVDRLSYKPVFIERQMVIQVLYDRLRDKSKVLTGKGVKSVEHGSDCVRVVTSDGASYSGEVLVGADGVHSTVRQEIRRLAREKGEKCFSPDELDTTPTNYSCIFGISKPNKKFPKNSSHNVAGSNHSYLVATGPGDRIYWFLFKKLPQMVHGYDNIPRYTDADRDALASLHENDLLMGELRFGELYQTKMTATLQAIPEFVFKRWHYGRCITIGDAAHKFNPLGGQGGNSAIEDAAVLADKLYELMGPKTSGLKKVDESSITLALEQTESLRMDRVQTLLTMSKGVQSLFARENLLTKLFIKFVMPYAGPGTILDTFGSNTRPAARIKSLSIPDRPHTELYFDERAEMPLKTSTPRYIAYLIFLGLTAGAWWALKLPAHLTPPPTFLGTSTRSYFTGFTSFDEQLKMIVLTFADVIGWVDAGHTFQGLYLFLFIVPVLLIWYIESARQCNRASLIYWPVIFGLLMHIGGIGTIAPLSFLLGIYTIGGRETVLGYTIAKRDVQGLLPAIVLGYVLPTLTMFVPAVPSQLRQDLILVWIFSAVIISVCLRLFSEPLNFGVSLKKFQHRSLTTSTALETTYKIMTAITTTYHVLSVAALLYYKGEPTLALGRLLVPQWNEPEQHPGSQQAYMFTYLKYDLLYAVLSLVFYGICSIFELRSQGLVTTQAAVKAGALFVLSQPIIGPGASIVCLWWWREARLSSVSTRPEEFGKK